MLDRLLGSYPLESVLRDAVLPYLHELGERFFAVNNACPHKGASLCQGEIVIADQVVRCPWHHWNWRLGDGRLESDPRQRLRTYEVAVEGDEVILRV